MKETLVLDLSSGLPREYINESTKRDDIIRQKGAESSNDILLDTMRLETKLVPGRFVPTSQPASGPASQPVE